MPEMPVINNTKNKIMMERLNSIANKSAILFFIFLFAIISFLNKYPDGYIYSCGDFVQLINFQEKIKWYTDTFIDYGEGAINHLFVPVYQYIFYILQNIFGVRFISTFYSFIFLSFSFLSFYFSSWISNENLNYNKNAYVIACYSFLYAVNSYTCFSRFNLPNMFFAPYFYLPLLFAASHRYFIVETVYNKELFLCAIIYLISNFIWCNPSYFVAFAIILILYQTLTYIFNRPYRFKVYLLKNIIFYFVFICVYSVYLIPIAPILVGYTDYFSNHTSSMLSWIASQAVPINKTFALGERYYQNLSAFFYFLISLIAYLLFFAFNWLYVIIKADKRKIIYPIIVLFILFLLNKGNGLIFQEEFYGLFNSNPLLASLRSYDKVLIYLPYFLLLPFVLTKNALDNKKISSILVITTVICLFPLLNGNDLKKYYRIYDRNSDYNTSKYSPFVKIPEGYFKISAMVNRSESDFKILTVPWSLSNRDLKGWALFPKWQMVGVNPVPQFFNAPVIQMNSFSAFGDWNYGEAWNDEPIEDSVWILPFSGLLNANYMIFHKDIEKKYLDQSLPKIDFYLKNGYLDKIYSDEFIDFFAINKNFNLPHVYVPEQTILLDDFVHMPEWLLQEIKNKTIAFMLGESIRDKTIINDCCNGNRPIIEYKKINGSKYIIKVHRATNDFPLVLSETYNPLWNIYLQKDTIRKKSNIDISNLSISKEKNSITKNELKKLLKENVVSEIGTNRLKVKSKKIWTSLNSQYDYKEKFNIDFISKPLKGTIQNNNLYEGNQFNTLFAQNINIKHVMANGYSNMWIFQLDKIRKEFPGYIHKNSDGTYDFKIIIEFLPQKLLCIGKIITFTFCILMLCAFVFIKPGYKKQKTTL